MPDANRYGFAWAKATSKYASRADAKLVKLQERLTGGRFFAASRLHACFASLQRGCRIFLNAAAQSESDGLFNCLTREPS